MTSLKIEINRENLLGPLTNVTRVIGRSDIPILANVAITKATGGVCITATNLDIQLECIALAETKGRLAGGTLPAKVLLEAVKALPAEAELSIEFNKETATLVSGTTQISMHLLPLDDFPLLPDVKAEAEFLIRPAVLRVVLESVNYAVSTEETRFYLNGVALHAKSSEQVLQFVATDGHRMGLAEIELPEDHPGDDRVIIVPSKTVSLILKSLSEHSRSDDEIAITYDADKVYMEIGKTRICSKLINGTYPEFERVIPQNNSNIWTAEPKPMIDAIARALVVAQKSHLVRLNWKTDTLDVAIEDGTYGTAQTAAPVAQQHGDQVELGINGEYFAETLRKIGQFAMVHLGSPGDAILITPKAPFEVEDLEIHSQHVIMPVRIM